MNLFAKKSDGGQRESVKATVDLVTPSRIFIKEGVFTKVSQKKDIKYIFILFNDLLIYCSERPDHKLILHRKINIADEFFRIESAIILDDEEEKSGGGKKKGNRRSNTFEIHSIEKSFLCYADSAEKREEWIDAIETC